jgi:hypothetical protein
VLTDLGGEMAWVLLSYGMPLGLAIRHGTRSALAGSNGTWFLWTGMYSAASLALGGGLGVRWLATVGRDGTWVVFAVWAVVFVAMLVSLAGLLRSPRPGSVSRPE